MRKRGNIFSDYLIYWIIGILILVVSLVAYGIISGRFESASEFFSNILRFGR